MALQQSSIEKTAMSQEALPSVAFKVGSVGWIVIARTVRLACFRNERAEAPRVQFKEASMGVGRRATWRLSSKAAST
ncbi:hypothetical protein MHUMG1_03739 [Metarhizium humberi]|uniref:Uncharacterized protein n=1 Tax=Metarhizium humberi TaxID=2596975 RepID=A0A9P8S888_9HYPO|nr:hypothetical protein MHUMG1_03739 [Metarhizium humberi]